MDGEAPYRIGLRVNDVDSAALFYEGLGFRRMGQIPDPDGRAVMIILRHGDLQLLVDALEGPPFPDSPRERRTTQCPRAIRRMRGSVWIRVEVLPSAAQSAA
jgi:hypothetical protein